MRLIKPKQISGEIMTLLDESDEHVIIISPYAQTKNWKKLQNTFKDLKKRNIPIQFYYRKGENKTQEEIEFLEIESIAVENLHCKIYMNEKSGIVASMNLYQYSDINSLDIAYRTETKKEYKDLKNFYKRYIKPYSIEVLNIRELNEELCDDLDDVLIKKYRTNIEDDNEIILTYGNSKYFFEINDLKELELEAIISRKQYDYITKNKITEPKSLEYEIVKGSGNQYDIITSSIELKSSSLNHFLETDYEYFFNSIIEFVTIIDSMKENEYNNRKE